MPSLPQDPELYYETHVLFCCNQRPEGHPRSCCADRGGRDRMEYLNRRMAEEGIGTVTVTEAGCMERCELGPAMVVYPDAVWYSLENDADVDEIIESHLKGGKPVERLVLEVDRRIPKPKPSQLLELKVSAVKNETKDIKSYELVAPDGGDLPPFDAGAHIDVLTEGGLKRSYSIASDPADRKRYLLGVLREPESRGGSAWMHDAVKQGGTISVTEPLNNFPLADGAGPHILIAGGIGITPILAMARTLKARGADFELHYCTRSPEQTAFLDEVRDVAGDNLTLHHDGGDPSRGIDLATTLKDQPKGKHVYICGPGGLITAAREAASHWSQGSVHYELFAAAPAGDWKNEEFEIYLSRRRLDLTVPADRSILEVIRGEGIAIDSSCEQGLCSTCQVRLISGEAEHRDQILSDEEKARGDKILTCVSRAKAGEKLVLDI